jgi:eukaryotic-like serine/threonine-protein kinase
MNSGDERSSGTAGDDPTVVGAPVSVSASSPPRTLPEGSLVGRYVVLEHVASGGMGMVLRAYDPKLRREIALKLVRSSTTRRSGDGDETQLQLLREAQALARLSHPNVVTVYDAEATEHGVAIAMEYIEGSTLRTWLRERARPWPEVLAVVLAAARGLAAAHAAGLVHRDIKPGNVLVSSQGRVYVTDFGLARDLDPLAADDASGPAADDHATSSGTVMGTPAYMAPEQHAGLAADARADQYALCVLLWEAGFGSRPFRGNTLAELAEAKAHGPPERPQATSAPRWVHEIVARGLEFDPAQRWPSVDALIAALASGQARTRRRRMVVAMGVAAVMVIGVAAWQRWDEARRVAACEHQGRSIAQVWDTGAKAKLREALLSTGASYAETTHDKVVPWIERWTAQWSSMRTQLCLEATVEKTRSVALHELSIACLDERTQELASLLEVLATSDETTLQRAVPSAARLSRLEPCADRRSLERRPEPPKDPTLRRAVTDLRRELMRVRAMAAAGHYASSHDRAEALLRDARELEHAPLTIEARACVGRQAWKAGRLERAEEALTEAYVEAGSLGADELAAEAAAALIHTVGYEAARHGEGLAWGRVAQMLVHRLDQADGLLGANWLNGVAAVHLARGAYVEALETFERVLHIRQRILGDEHPTSPRRSTTWRRLIRRSNTVTRLATCWSKRSTSTSGCSAPTTPTSPKR